MTIELGEVLISRFKVCPKFLNVISKRANFSPIGSTNAMKEVKCVGEKKELILLQLLLK